jgi:8-oxo-dGTP pyrophosphatase MutT (NUDIX family)
MSNIPDKVRAVIFYRKPSLKVLVFDQPDYPEAGVQIPGGTVDPGEKLEETLERELVEETGVSFKGKRSFINSRVITHPVTGNEQREHTFCIEVSADSLSETWTHNVTGGGEDEGINFRYYWEEFSKAKEDLWCWMATQVSDVEASINDL